MKIKVINSDWHTKSVAIKNKTVRTLKNGKTIPTWLNVQRQAAKI